VIAEINGCIAFHFRPPSLREFVAHNVTGMPNSRGSGKAARPRSSPSAFIRFHEINVGSEKLLQRHSRQIAGDGGSAERDYYFFLSAVK